MISLCRLLIGFTIVLTPLAAYSQEIEIKGIRVGMTKEEVQEKYPSWRGFTIAGVKGKYENLPVQIKYREEQLDQFLFFFLSSNFESVLEAVKDKYPKIRCESSQLENAMGAKYQQVTCTLSDLESVLQLQRYVDLRTSVLSLMSQRAIKEQMEKSREKKKDI